MDDLNADQLQQLVALGVIPDRQRGLDKQMEIAQQLRMSDSPSGRMVGRVYVADPLGSLATGLDRYQGNKQLKTLRASQDKLLDQQTQARMAFVNALRQRGQQGVPPQGTPPLGAPQPPPPGVAPPGPQGNGVTTYPMQQ